MNASKVSGKLGLLPIPSFGEIESFVHHCTRVNASVLFTETLRQRDFSTVTRVFLRGEVETLIYKSVVSPWDVEAEITQHISDCALPNIPRVLGSRKIGRRAQLLMEDVGSKSLRESNSPRSAVLAGIGLAQIHEKVTELAQVFPSVIPRLDSREKLEDVFAKNAWNLANLFPDFKPETWYELFKVGKLVANSLGEAECYLHHCDAYAENIMLRNNTNPVFIDWSYFCFYGPRLYDLATLVSNHTKNAILSRHRELIIKQYANYAGLSTLAVEIILPAAYRLSRLLFLQWLLVRVDMGIMHTTVGPVRPVIEAVVGELID